jgi:hypothetical protein
MVDDWEQRMTQLGRTKSTHEFNSLPRCTGGQCGQNFCLHSGRRLLCY